MDDSRTIPGSGRNFLYSPPRPDWLWGPQNILSNGYWGPFSRR